MVLNQDQKACHAKRGPVECNPFNLGTRGQLALLPGNACTSILSHPTSPHLACSAHVHRRVLYSPVTSWSKPVPVKHFTPEYGLMIIEICLASFICPGDKLAFRLRPSPLLLCLRGSPSQGLVPPHGQLDLTIIRLIFIRSIRSLPSKTGYYPTQPPFRSPGRP